MHAFPLLAAALLCSPACSPDPAQAAAPGALDPSERAERSASVNPAEPGSSPDLAAATDDNMDGPVDGGDDPMDPTGVATLGARAPSFRLEDAGGTSHSLADYAGKIVVLEWFNPECPFVVHAHRRGPLAELPLAMQERGVVWLAINSAGPGEQGHGAERNREIVREWGLEHPVLLDPEGEVGRRYAARTTPEVCVIDPSGILVYRGSLDNAPRGQVKGESHEVWVEQVLNALLANTTLPRRESDPYGCGVRYAARKESR